MQFRREELEEATAQFSFGCLIGTGAYGTVYLGKNLHNSGTSVAVKVLNKSGVKAVIIGGEEQSQFESSSSDARSQLEAELSALTKYRHPNLVDLMGYCTTTLTALVYEYLPMGSLYHNIHESAKLLSWEQRGLILKDTCRALAYLHAGSPPLVHQDVKSLNILLDQNGYTRQSWGTLVLPLTCHSRSLGKLWSLLH